MKRVGIAFCSLLVLGCSDGDIAATGLQSARGAPPDTSWRPAGGRHEALRRAAMAIPESDAPLRLFTGDAAQVGWERAGNDRLVRKRQLRLVDDAGRVQLPERFVLNLSAQHQPEVRLGRFSRRGDTYEVWRARTEDPRLVGVERYDNAVFVVNRRDNQLFGSVDIAGAAYDIRPTTDGYVVRRSRRFEPQADCGFDASKHARGEEALAGRPAPRHGEVSHDTLAQSSEQDDCGTYILDVFFGFTESAAAELGDIEAHALLLTETANSGLSNSGIDDVRLRMVGAVTTSWEPTGDGFDALGEALGIGDDFLQAEAAATGSDFQAMIISQAAGSGLAYAPGYQSAVGPDTRAWRHEWGHNAGSSHCSPESGFRPYAHGWDAGPDHATHMCGNEYNIYSTPLLTIDGFKMGDETVADNTRLIRERAEEMATRATHVIPYEPCGGGAGGTGVVGGAGGTVGSGGSGVGGTAGGTGVGGTIGTGGSGANGGAGGDPPGAGGTGTGATAGSTGVGGASGTQAGGASGSGATSSQTGGAGGRSAQPTTGCACTVRGTPLLPNAWTCCLLVLGALSIRLRRRYLDSAA